MKVAIFVTELTIGGAQLESLSITKIFLDQGDDVYFIYNGRGILQNKIPIESNILILKSLVRNISLVKDLISCILILKFLYRVKPDVCIYFAPKVSLLCSISSFLIKTPKRIYRNGGILYNHLQNSFISFFWRTIDRLICYFSTHVLFVSKLNRYKAIDCRVVDSFKSSVIHTMLDLKSFRMYNNNKEEIRKLLNIPQNAFVVLQVSSLINNKRPQDFLEIAKKIISNDNSIFFILVGDGPLFSNLYNSSINIPNFKLLGPRFDIDKIMSISDILTLTSIYPEGLPQVCAQGLASGLPLVMYDWEGTREELEHMHNGILIDPLNVSKFIEAILLLKNNNDLFKRLKYNAATYNLSYHDELVCKDKWLNIINQND